MRYDPAPNVPGAWFVVGSVLAFVPEEATAAQLEQTIKTLAALASERTKEPPCAPSKPSPS